MLNNCVISDWVLRFAENGVLRPDVVLVYVDVGATWHIEFSVLVWQNCHLVWVVLLHHNSTFVRLYRNAVLDIVLQLIVASFKLVLLAVLVTDLDRESLLLAILSREIM